MNEKRPRIAVQGENGEYHEIGAREARILGLEAVLKRQEQQSQQETVRRGGRLGRPSEIIPTTVQDPQMYGGSPYYGGQYSQPPVIIKQYFGGQPSEAYEEEYVATRYDDQRTQAGYGATAPALSFRDEMLALASGPHNASPQGTGESPSSAEATSAAIIDKLKANPRITLAGVAAVALVVAVTGVAKSSEGDVPTGTEASMSKESKAKGSEFQLRPYDVPAIAKYDANVTGSTMWNFTDKPFEARYAVGTAPDDASWDLNSDPEFTISAKLPYDPATKNMALSELPKNDGKRVIQIDMSKAILDISVDPKTLDTTTINLFKLATPSEQDKILLSSKLDPKKFRDTYEKNKNDAESQAVGLAAAAILADPEHRSEILSRAKTKMMTTLKLTNNDQFELRFIGDDKFGAQVTVADAKYPGLEQQFPQAAVAALVKEMGYSGKHVRIINAPDRKPVVDAKLNEAKTA